jgi:putative FmdB family regulatory protein
MPIYEYLCVACGHTLDALQKLSDDPLVHCPTCGAPELKRQLSAPRFRLKGKGWYETDFKGKGDKQRNLADSDSKSGDSKPDKPESKPESKPDAKPAADSKPAAESKPAKPGGKAGGDA